MSEHLPSVRTIRVFEHERLTTTPNSRGEYLSESELESLCYFNDVHSNKYYINIRNGVKFSNYVGVIQVGKLTLEILPKVDKENSGGSREVLITNWHGALLSMLKYCGFLKVSSVSEASLKRNSNSLLDLYFSQFLDEVEELVHRGLVKKYRSHSANTLALKGRILFNKHINLNIVRKERFYTQHSTYDHDHLINQILLVALNVLEKLTTNQGIGDRINRLKLSFPQIQTPTITAAHFMNLRIDRKTKPYINALKIAEMIILNYSTAITGGRTQLLAILFDMNMLWESYILFVLRRNGEAYRISAQSHKEFWENRKVKPDIHLEHKASSQNYIIDTKWTLISANKPSDEDLRQIFAYNLYWNAKHSLLLYPKVNQQDSSFGKYHQGNAGGHFCKVGFINILDSSGKLNLNIGEDILRKLEA
jgi:5-methylcytosine-specific restriction enzyme subunit McrC